MSTAPRPVFVGVVNYNGAETLERTLLSVQALAGVNLAGLLVADNASTDGSVALVRRQFPQALIHQFPENRGPNPARNEILRRADTELVLIMDNDLVLAPDYVTRLAAVLEADPAAGAASGQIRLDGAPDTVQYNGLFIHYVGEIAARPPQERATAQVSCVSAGAALLVRRHVLRVGGFDEDFFIGWEDGDLTYRLSLAGHPCYLAPAAVAYHMRRARGLKWVQFQTRNRWWFLLKNYERRTLLLTLPAIAGFQLAAGFFCLLKGQGCAFLRGTLAAFRGWGQLQPKRRAAQALRVVPDRELLQGDRLDLPGGAGSGRAGRWLNSVLNAILRVYWLAIRPLLRRR